MLLFYGATACRFVYPPIERSTRVVVAAEVTTKNNIYSTSSNTNKIVIVSNKSEKTEFLPSVGKPSYGTRFTTALVVAAAAAAAVAVMIVAVGVLDSNYYAYASERQQQQQEQSSSQEQEETFANIPQLLSGDCSDSSSSKDCKKVRIQRPKSRKAETCTIKCVTTCIRGGLGSPGEGPFNIRRPLVVFKEGFRSRRYCLVECSDICNLIKDSEDDGP
ncbi:uncharacterized protein LOC124946128 [Impatiens glandulifera]|uniref:uncharacterized protein LOC124946128 n=1 Tax=Impatiens glandulifera TaxID=253017 RepID=UPI001FB0B89D|nr:uncharacterized protein LOC124946128 [Impatiens glandulifera]